MFLGWWWEKDSNLRRRKPADLQSALVGHLSIPPTGATMQRARNCAKRRRLVNPGLDRELGYKEMAKQCHKEIGAPAVGIKIRLANKS